jgi:hypothetical protein
MAEPQARTGAEKTLGELAAQVGRYKAQVIPLAILLILALFFEGTRPPSSETAAPSAIAENAAAQLGAPSLASSPAPEVDGLELGRDIDTLVTADLSAAGPSTGGEPAAEEPAAPSGPAVAPFTCANDASLPMPVFAPVMEQLRATLPPDLVAYIAGAADCSPGTDPLTLVVAQLGPVIGAAGPVIDVLRVVNGALPPLPVPPSVPFPEVPPELAPVVAGIVPVTKPVCDELAIAVLVPAIMANFPTPISAQHLGPVLGVLFDACAALRPPAAG